MDILNYKIQELIRLFHIVFEQMEFYEIYFTTRFTCHNMDGTLYQQYWQWRSKRIVK